jgi:hypothetical protein
MVGGWGRSKGALVLWAGKKEADRSVFTMARWMLEMQTPDLEALVLSPWFRAALGGALRLFPSGCDAMGF